jgi:hypothetical protein
LHAPVIPAFGRFRQKELEFEVGLSCIVTLSQKKKKILEMKSIREFFQSVKHVGYNTETLPRNLLRR